MLALLLCLSACSSTDPDGSDLLWLDEQCPPDQLDDMLSSHRFCRFQPPARALLPWPLADSARLYWENRGERVPLRPFAGDVLMAIGTDEPGTFSFVTDDDIEGIGLSSARAWQRALANVDRYAVTAEIHRYANGTHWVSSHAISAVALVFAHSLWKREEFKYFNGAPAIALAGRDHFFVADSADSHAVEALRRQLIVVHCLPKPDDYPDFCSPNRQVFVRSRNGWAVLR